MAKGKKTSPEMIHKIIAEWTVNHNYSQTARELNIPISTVKNVVVQNKDAPEYIALCEKAKKTFSDKATAIIDKALLRLEREIDDVNKEIPINHLTTAIGTLYDKRALADGNATENVKIEIKLPKEADDYAG